MLNKKWFLVQINALISIMLLATQAVGAQATSESKRLEKLERAVELLEKQNAELRAEVNSLKSKEASNPADAKFKTKITYDPSMSSSVGRN